MRTTGKLRSEVEKLAAQVQRLSAELEAIEQREATPQRTSFEKIDALAAHCAPLRNPVLGDVRESVKCDYLSLLSAVAQADEQCSPDQLVYLIRIARGAGVELDAETLVGMGVFEKGKEPQGLLYGLPDLRYSLIVDALMLAYMDGKTSEKAVEIISILAAALGCTVDDVAVLSELVVALLTVDQGAFNAIEGKKPYPGLKHIIPEKWLADRRHACDEINVMKRVYGIIGWTTLGHIVPVVKEGEYIKAGAVVAEGKNETTVFATFSAPVPGFVHYQDEKPFIVSCFDTRPDATFRQIRHTESESEEDLKVQAKIADIAEMMSSLSERGLNDL